MKSLMSPPTFRLAVFFLLITLAFVVKAEKFASNPKVNLWESQNYLILPLLDSDKIFMGNYQTGAQFLLNVRGPVATAVFDKCLAVLDRDSVVHFFHTDQNFREVNQWDFRQSRYARHLKNPHNLTANPEENEIYVSSQAYASGEINQTTGVIRGKVSKHEHFCH
jgi:hypothetical protein